MPTDSDPREKVSGATPAPSSSLTICAACPIDVGECPRCGTFFVRQGNKRYGVQPVTSQGPTSWWRTLNDLPNVVTR